MMSTPTAAPAPKNNNAVTEDDEDDEFVPESLRQFISGCMNDLDDAQSDFMEIAETPSAVAGGDLMDDTTNNNNNNDTLMTPPHVSDSIMFNPVAQLSDTEVKRHVQNDILSPPPSQPVLFSPSEQQQQQQIIDLSDHVDEEETLPEPLKPTLSVNTTQEKIASSTAPPLQPPPKVSLHTVLANDAGRAAPPTPSSDVTGPQLLLPTTPARKKKSGGDVDEEEEPSPLSMGSATGGDAVVWEATARFGPSDHVPAPSKHVVETKDQSANRMQRFKSMFRNATKHTPLPPKPTPPRSSTTHRSRVTPTDEAPPAGDLLVGWGQRTTNDLPTATATELPVKKSPSSSQQQQRASKTPVNATVPMPTGKVQVTAAASSSPASSQKRASKTPTNATTAPTPNAKAQAVASNSSPGSSQQSPSTNPAAVSPAGRLIQNKADHAKSSPSSSKKSITERLSPGRSSPSKTRKFTASAAERLSQPKQDVYVPKAVEKSTAKFTAQAAERLSQPKEAPVVLPERKKTPAKFTAEAAERLSQPRVEESAVTVADTSPPTPVKPLAEHSHLLKATAVSNAHVARPTPDDVAPPLQPEKVPPLKSTSHLLQSTELLESRKAPVEQVQPLSPLNPDKVDPIKESSHLLKATSASKGHKTTTPSKNETPTKRVASKIRSSSHLLTPTTASTAHKTKVPAVPKEQQRPPVPARKVVSGVSKRLLQPTTASKKHNEGVAKARERIREHRRKEREGSSFRRTPTIPKEPKFSTRKPVVTNKRSPHQPLAVSSSVFGKGLREEKKRTTTTNKPAQLTIPTTPRFSSGARHGDNKPKRKASVPLADSSKVLKSALRASYVPPKKLHTKKTETGLTIADSPKFTSKKRRELPKSREDREAEEMEYFRKHPFKARPMPGRLSVDTGHEPAFMKPTRGHLARQSATPKAQPRVNRVPLQARPANHAVHNNRRNIGPSRLTELTASAKKRLELIADQKRRQANEHQEEPVSPSINRPMTQQEPFRLASMSRHEKSREEQSKRAAMEEAKRRRDSVFRARPMPESVYPGMGGGASPAIVTRGQALAERRAREEQQARGDAILLEE